MTHVGSATLSLVHRSSKRTPDHAMSIILALGALAAVGGLVWWRFFHVARPAVPPLALAPDDPLILAAHEQAKRSVARFRLLAM